MLENPKNQINLILTELNVLTIYTHLLAHKTAPRGLFALTGMVAHFRFFTIQQICSCSWNSTSRATRAHFGGRYAVLTPVRTPRSRGLTPRSVGRGGQKSFSKKH
jgi:hypothetical protein